MNKIKKLPAKVKKKTKAGGRDIAPGKVLGPISRTGGKEKRKEGRKRKGERARNNVCHMVTLSNFSMHMCTQH